MPRQGHFLQSLNKHREIDMANKADSKSRDKLRAAVTAFNVRNGRTSEDEEAPKKGSLKALMSKSMAKLGRGSGR